MIEIVKQFADVDERFIVVRPIAGYEDLYAVSRLGEVWAHPKKSRLKGRWLKQSKMAHGYLYVCLFKEGKRKNVYVHRLVAEAFLPRIEGKDQVNHKDGIKTNNEMSNLEWVNPSENRLHAFKTGLQKVSEKQREASRQNIINFHRSKKNV